MSVTKAPTVRPAPGTDEALDVLENLSRAVGALRRDDPDAAAAFVAKARASVTASRAKLADVPERPSDVHIVLRIEGDLLDGEQVAEQVLRGFRAACARSPRSVGP